MACEKCPSKSRPRGRAGYWASLVVREVLVRKWCWKWAHGRKKSILGEEALCVKPEG